MIDIGANLTNKRFARDLDAVIVRAREAGVQRAVVTGTSEQASRDALRLVHRYAPFLRSTAGVHPHDASTWTYASAAAIEAIAGEQEVVAVGECGLDFNRDFSPRQRQEECFRAQLNIAARIGKPVFLHQRDAHDRFLTILREFRPSLSGAVIHCFTDGEEALFDYLELDCHIGITGWVCDDRRGGALREAVPHIPLDRLLIETDAPYLTPRTLRPKPRGGRNEPAFLPHVCGVLADLLDVAPDELARRTAENAERFFGL